MLLSLRVTEVLLAGACGDDPFDEPVHPTSATIDNTANARQCLIMAEYDSGSAVLVSRFEESTTFAQCTLLASLTQPNADRSSYVLSRVLAALLADQ